MNASDITGLIVSGSLAALIIAAAVLLLTGRGSFLIAGFNTLSKKEKENYDISALCKFMGKILLPIGLTTPLPAISGIFDIAWLAFAFPAVTLGLVIFAAIYANTGGRFKKNVRKDND